MSDKCADYPIHCYHNEGVQTRDYFKQLGCKKPDKVKYYVSKCCRCGQEKLTVYDAWMNR
jgi:hypothetical protein